MQEVDAAARSAEDAEALAVSENLLWHLRSDEVRATPAELASLSAHAGVGLSVEFKAEAGASARKLSEAIAKSKITHEQKALAKKATEAREAQRPDPKSWFEVTGESLVALAAIEAEPMPRVEHDGTVTLEVIQVAKSTLKNNLAAADEQQTVLKEETEKNADLASALALATKQVSAESTRAATAALAETAKAEERTEAVAAANTALAQAATDLQAAVAVKTFAVTPDGVVVGIPAGGKLPDGAIVIPGGDAVRLSYLMPKLKGYLAAFDALAAAKEEARLAAEAAAATEDEEYNFVESGEPGEQPVGPTTPPVEPDPPVGPPVDPPVDPPVETTDPPSGG